MIDEPKEPTSNELTVEYVYHKLNDIADALDDMLAGNKYFGRNISVYDVEAVKNQIDSLIKDIG
jgi:hypothetical protein